MKISGIIPCADVNVDELRQLFEETRSFTDNYICVLNSADLDYQYEISQFLKHFDNVRVTAYGQYLGKAEAIRFGLAESLRDPGTEVIYQMDGHLKQAPGEIHHLIRLLDDADIAIYERYTEPEHYDSEHRRLLATLMSSIVQKLSTVSVLDTVCGTRCFRRSFAADFLATSQSVSYGLEMEQLLFAGTHDYRIASHYVYSKAQADCTATEKLITNLYAILALSRMQSEDELRRELNALTFALGHGEPFSFDASLVDATRFGSIAFAPVPNGEDNEHCYRLSE